MAPAKLVAKLTNPSFLCIHPSGNYLYAVTETVRGAGGEDARCDGVQDRSQRRLNSNQFARAEGDIPCYVSTDPEGKLAFVANYGNGSLAMLPINTMDRLSPQYPLFQTHGL